MSGYGRNSPCPCGSGRKAKRCCGVARGPGGEELARAFVAGQARAAAPAVARLTDGQLRESLERLPELPALDLSLVVRLPDLVSPELDRLLTAVAEDDLDAIDDSLPPVMARLDTCAARAELARAVVSLRETGRLDEGLAAVALLSLHRGATLFEASLLRAAAIATGTARTPAGLLVAA